MRTPATKRASGAKTDRSQSSARPSATKHARKGPVSSAAASSAQKEALTQISARIPGDLKSQFDALVERKGLRKEFVVEEALRFHLRALQEIPSEYIMPSRLVLDAKSSRRVVDALTTPPEASEALAALVRGDKRAGDY
jgi:uncharacterized protein (DUF1778 family)